MDKLRRWWKAHWDTDLEQKNCIVCYFCVWDLRFLEEYSEVKEPPDQLWWPKYETHRNVNRNYYKKYYTEKQMKPCSVKITLLANEDNLLNEYRQKGFGQRHRCLFCPQSYGTHQNLFIHAKTVHPDKFFYCNKLNCGKFFHTKKEKAEHIKKEHQAKKESLKCVYCGKVSTNKANHLYHLLKHHRSQIIRCPDVHCKVMFKTKEERDIHVNNFHSSGKFFCCFCNRYFECHKAQWHHIKKNHKEALKCNAKSKCPNYFKTEEDRQKHVDETHSQNYNCIYCNLSLQTRSSLSTHVRVFHKDVALKCEYTQICSTFYQTEEERQKHYKEDHEKGADKVLCPICKKKFSNKGIICQHFRTHHKKEIIIKCDYAYLCSNYFSCEEDKLRHIQEFHESHDEKFRCVFCEKLFPKTLKDHIKKWHKDVAIRCNFHEMRCATYFKTSEDRDKHVREVHQAEKIREAVPCLYCNKILSGMDTLRVHIVSKHPEIAIKCQYPQCGTYFKSQDYLEKHFSLKPKHKPPLKKKELLIEPFICTLCQKSFHFKSQLKQHLMSKHRRTMEKCPHCKRLTSSKSSHIMSDFCKVCNKQFQCLGLLRSHRLKCKPVSNCPVCSVSFKKPCELNYHCKIKHTVPIQKWRGVQFESRGFKCDDCLIYFSSKGVLQKHTRIIHRSAIFTCDFCKKKCAYKESVKSHISRNHLGLMKFFHCPVCNLKLDGANMLRKHVQNKCNKKLVQCQICAKTMTTLALRKHMKHIH